MLCTNNIDSKRKHTDVNAGWSGGPVYGKKVSHYAERKNPGKEKKDCNILSTEIRGVIVAFFVYWLGIKTQYKSSKVQER